MLVCIFVICSRRRQCHAMGRMGGRTGQRMGGWTDGGREGFFCRMPQWHRLTRRPPRERVKRPWWRQPRPRSHPLHQRLACRRRAATAQLGGSKKRMPGRRRYVRAITVYARTIQALTVCTTTVWLWPDAREARVRRSLGQL